MDYYYSDKGKKAELHGRGLSVGDTFEMFGFRLPSIIQDSDIINIYKPAVLRFKCIDEEAIPVLQYEGEDEEALCYVFQIKLSSGKYVDLNLHVLSRALTLM